MFKNSEKKAVLATYYVTDDGGCDGGSWLPGVAYGAFLLLLLAAVIPLSPFPWLPASPPLFSLFSFSFSLWFSLSFFFPFLFFSFSFLPFLFSLRWLLGQGLKWINFGLIHKPRVGNNAKDKSKNLILDDICILMHIMSKTSLSGS